MLALLSIQAHGEVVVVVNVKSAVSALNKSQVSDIFLGKSQSFPDGTRAKPLEHTSGSPQREEFHGKVTGKTGSQLHAYWAKQVFSAKGPAPKEFDADAHIVKELAADPNAIAYVDKSSLDASLKVVYTP